MLSSIEYEKKLYNLGACFHCPPKDTLDHLLPKDSDSQ